MGRPRAFDETKTIKAAAELFAQRSYDGVSVDDLVTHLGVHRNSLYKTFGSKRGIYLAALRWYVDNKLQPSLALISDCIEHPDTAHVIDSAANTADLDFLLMAAIERAPIDTEVADLITKAFTAIEHTLAALVNHLDTSVSGTALTAAMLGVKLRTKAAMPLRNDAI